MVSSPRALRNYINGAFVDPHGESRADIISPVTGGVVATAPISDAADVDAAYAAASAAFK
ncbi:MAG TPA: gamma-aminobutyraldehyde dehydrogenase, partial [Propionibacteriaceae bacterium]|nr:gamma-aminobutyraldehyde dehydrogenase [Propionibacteriaceae bacterium]